MPSGVDAHQPDSVRRRLHSHLDDCGFSLDAYVQFLQRFVETLQLEHYVIWLHDYGS